jgi:peptide/nickel transport system ATP-binding protein
MSALEIDNVSVEYHRRGRDPVRAVVGASVTVEPGQIVGLVGESGCGKSTLARAAVGLVAPSSGSVRFDSRPVVPLTRRARPKDQLGLQMVFQNPRVSLNPRRRIEAQIMDGLPAALTGRTARRDRVEELLTQVGLPLEAANRYLHEFSGGQRQRVAIARALATSPSVLVLDEPLSSLDASAQAQIANLLGDLKRELGLGMLLISHDLAIVRQVADAVAVMYLGCIVEFSPTRELWADPQHPYSAALIGAIPRVDGKRTLPLALPGEVPDPAHPPTGCRFHPRCPVAIERCPHEEPHLVPVSERRQVSCWLHPGRDVALAGSAASEMAPAASDPNSG